MRTRTVAIAGMALMGVITAALAIEGHEQANLMRATEGRRVEICDFAVARDGTVSGVLCNVSSEPVRDVRLLIERTWVATGAPGAGTDLPGRTELHTIEETIPPGGRLPFSYHPSAPIPTGPEGHYDTSVSVVGLVAVGRISARG